MKIIKKRNNNISYLKSCIILIYIEKLTFSNENQLLYQ